MSILITRADLPKLGMAPVDCYDGFGSCMGGGGLTQGGFEHWFPFTGYAGTGGGVAAPITTVNCEGVIINGQCTGGVKPAPPPPVVCTMDAKLCPDGSSVGRDPENDCNFRLCPQPQTTAPPVVSSEIPARFFDLIKANPIPSLVVGGILAYAILGSGKK